jgi:hypothetical protein
LAEYKWFRSLIFVMILINCGLLGLDSPPRFGEERVMLDIIQLPIYASFIVEMGVLLVGQGINSYWKDPWNRMDFLIVIGSIADLATYYTMNRESATSESLSVMILFTGLLNCQSYLCIDFSQCHTCCHIDLNLS